MWQEGRSLYKNGTGNKALVLWQEKDRLCGSEWKGDAVLPSL